MRAFQEKSKQKRTGLFWRTLISYISVLLLPIIICSFYYFHSYHALKERTVANQKLVLENLAEQVNSAFRDAINLGSHLQLNQYVTVLSNNKNTLNSSPVMDRYYLKKDLAALQVSNALIQKIDLYFPCSEYIVNTGSTYQLSLLEIMEPRSNTLTAADWKAILNFLKSNRIICYSGSRENFITVAQVLLTDISDRPLCVLCTQIDKKALLNRLQNQLFSEYSYTFALINRENLLFASKDPGSLTLPLDEIFDNFESGTDTSPYEIEMGQKMMIDFYSLQIPGTALILVTEKTAYRAQMTQLLEIMLLTISFCFFCGIIVTMYYSRKNYEPVSQILHFIRGTSGNMDPEKNEYHLIMKILTQNRNEIEKQRKLLKNNYLQKIFSGEIDFGQIPEPVAEQFALRLASPAICVVSLSADGSGSLSGADSALELTAFVIENVYQELLSEQFPDNYFSVRGKKISVLINVPKQLSSPLLTIEKLTGEMIVFLSEAFRLSPGAGISGIHQKEEIPAAYLQADTALEYRRLFETEKICLYDTIPQKQTIGSIPLNTSEYVINLVVSGNRPQILEYFRTIEKNMEKCVLSWADAKSCYYFFYQATAKLQLYCQTHFGMQTVALNFMDESFFTQSLPRALSQTCEAYLTACDEIAQKCSAPSQVHWGRDICRFIDNNYFDANINLNTVAEHFQLSPSYLSKKFREQFCKSVVDYLYEVRIENAVSLLKETDLKITDIAQMTGFADSNAFIRIFKRYKGTTPGKYKGVKE